MTTLNYTVDPVTSADKLAVNKEYVDKYGNNRSHLVGLHAECDALIKLGETDCSGYSFVNIRITPMNKVGYACYCNGCYNLLKQVGYKKLYFSYDDAGNFNQIV